SLYSLSAASYAGDSFFEAKFSTGLASASDVDGASVSSAFARPRLRERSRVFSLRCRPRSATCNAGLQHHAAELLAGAPHALAMAHTRRPHAPRHVVGLGLLRLLRELARRSRQAFHRLLHPSLRHDRLLLGKVFAAVDRLAQRATLQPIPDARRLAVRAALLL